MTSGFDLSRSLFLLAMLWASVGLAGCVTSGTEAVTPETAQAAAAAPPAPPPAPDPAVPVYIPSTEPMRLGLQHFSRGNYGLAERYFRDVVEKDPNNAMAWIGLAGSYDHIARFDLADRAYRTAIRLSGETPQILNNMGYSYILRGQYRNARRYIMKAYALEPNDPTIASNLALIDSLDSHAHP